jgi:2-polyprenyl-3-methyl-5-hydroxy-6-metoxy-1,4-benzoquinol methylase
MIFNEKSKEALDNFLNLYNEIIPIDKNKAKIIIKNTIKYYKKSSEKRNELEYIQDLENLWYDKLTKKEDYNSVYNEEYYFTDLWACWTIYSKKYIKELTIKKIVGTDTSIFEVLKDATSILDLGCGIGYTTASLQQLFPNAIVFGSNVENTPQYLFCKYMSRKYGFNIVSRLSDINQDIDLVFASEFFEHIEDPFLYIKEVIENFNPKFFIIANSFNTKAIGHFTKYKDRFIILQQEDTSKKFNKFLKSFNYKKLKTNLWNSRPSIWIKI